MPPAFRRRDADVAEPARRPSCEQRGQVLLPGEQIVHLQEIEARHAPVLARGFDLRRPARAGRDPHLVGREQRSAAAELLQARSR